MNEQDKTTRKITKEMSDYINNFINKKEIKERYDYKSVSEFVRSAIREKLEKHHRDLEPSIEEM